MHGGYGVIAGIALRLPTASDTGPREVKKFRATDGGQQQDTGPSWVSHLHSPGIMMVVPKYKIQ